MLSKTASEAVGATRAGEGLGGSLSAGVAGEVTTEGGSAEEIGAEGLGATVAPGSCASAIPTRPSVSANTRTPATHTSRWGAGASATASLSSARN